MVDQRYWFWFRATRPRRATYVPRAEPAKLVPKKNTEIKLRKKFKELKERKKIGRTILEVSTSWREFIHIFDLFSWLFQSVRAEGLIWRFVSAGSVKIIQKVGEKPIEIVYNSKTIGGNNRNRKWRNQSKSKLFEDLETRSYFSTYKENSRCCFLF